MMGTDNKKMRNFKGLMWGNLTVEEKRYLLKDFKVIDASTNCYPKESMFCIIDLVYPYSIDAIFISSYMNCMNDTNDEEDEIIIERDNIIYCCEDCHTKRSIV